MLTKLTLILMKDSIKNWLTIHLTKAIDIIKIMANFRVMLEQRKSSGYCSGGSIMKPLYFRKLPKLPISRVLVAFLLVIVLAACGTNAVTNTTSSPAGPHPSSTVNKLIKTPTAIPSVSPTVLKLNAAKIAEDAGSLSIQSDLDFQ